jgi:hypothetical protein
VWKLVRSGWLDRLHKGRPGRVLFLADRVVLRDQAYNNFSPFADGTSDPRLVIQGHPPNLNLYFGIYQTLWSEDEQGRRLFQRFPLRGRRRRPPHPGAVPGQRQERWCARCSDGSTQRDLGKEPVVVLTKDIILL